MQQYESEIVKQTMKQETEKGRIETQTKMDDYKEGDRAIGRGRSRDRGRGSGRDYLQYYSHLVFKTAQTRCLGVDDTI